MSRILPQPESHTGPAEETRAQKGSIDKMQSNQHQQHHINLSPSTMYPQPGYYDPGGYPQPHHFPTNGWQGNGFVNADSGPSRSSLPSLPRELYAGYSQIPTQRSPYSDHATPPGSQLWNAMGGEIAPPAVQQRRVSPSIPVKLEDLVSQDRDTSGKGGTSNGPGGLSSVPLTSAASTDTPRVAQPKSTAKSVNAEAPAASAPSDFIKKLYKLLEEERAAFGKGLGPGQPSGSNAKRGSVGWAKGGLSFVVWDMNDFSTKVLPQTFRHSNFSSFVRQLNKYGFSKIKHTDEETGALKENLWEFQHPNFQAGGHADLDSIKRKAAVSKKVDVDVDASPSGLHSGPLVADQSARLAEMENRVQVLEEQLASALEEVRQVNTRELGTAGLLRDILGHLAATDRPTSSQGTTPSDSQPSSRIGNMWQIFEQLVASFPPDIQPAISLPPRRSFAPTSLPGHPWRSSLTSSANQSSPHTAGSRRSQDSVLDSNDPASSGSASDTQAGMAGAATDLHSIPEQSMYPPDGIHPVYAEPPAWLTKGVTVPMPMYHRKNSDGVAFRLMLGALGTQSAVLDEVPDPLDSTLPEVQPNFGHPRHQPRLPTSNPPSSHASSSVAPIVQSSPFGTLLIPEGSAVRATAAEPKTKGGKAKSVTQNPSPDTVGKSLRRTSVDLVHWNRTPRVLVVEDDMVYRQLSKKFLEKFGCVVETVENAHEAIEMINRTKYDLVLMDIFFGPSMDGRKATSLIRQFDRYTPIISMTSNAQPQDITSYLQSGMNDILAKPFTKHGLFGILDKHLLHMKVLQLSAEVPRSVGVPPLSDQGVQEAVAQGAALASGLLNWENDEVRNPLAAMGWSDDTYQIVLDQFLRTGTMPDVSSFNFLTGQPMPPVLGSFSTGLVASGSGGGTVGPSAIFGDFNSRKRSLDLVNGSHGVATGMVPAGTEGEQEDQQGGRTVEKEMKKRKR